MKPSWLIVDASVLVATMNPSDEHHDNARGVIRRSVRQHLVSPSVTLAESAVGAVRRGREDVVRRAWSAFGITMFPRDDEEPLRLARLRATTSLAIPDCCVLDAAIEMHAPLATFDMKLASVAVGMGVSVVQ